MARPKKQNVEYFPHDNDMRNDRKIKVLRNKFGLEGFAVYCMILETLAEADNLEVEATELEIELIAGDFGIETKELKNIIDLMIKVKLLNKEKNIIFSSGLKKRMSPVFQKRQKSKEKYEETKKSFEKICTKEPEKNWEFAKKGDIKKLSKTGKEVYQELSNHFRSMNTKGFCNYSDSGPVNVRAEFLKLYRERGE